VSLFGVIFPDPKSFYAFFFLFHPDPPLSCGITRQGLRITLWQWLENGQ
jgi:hypothetical protein